MNIFWAIYLIYAYICGLPSTSLPTWLCAALEYSWFNPKTHSSSESSTGINRQCVLLRIQAWHASHYCDTYLTMDWSERHGDSEAYPG